MGRRIAALVAVVALGGTATAGLHAWAAYTSMRWTGTATFTLNRSSLTNVTASQAAAAIQTAMNAWNNAGANVTLALSGGDTNASQLAYDGVNAIFFRQDGGGAIATNYTWWNASHIVDSDIVFWNGGRVFATSSTGCSGAYYIEDIATHELGHGLGLDHSYFVDAAGKTATMYPSVGTCDDNFRSLSSDDIAGVRSLYGASSTGGKTSGGATVTLPQMSSPALGSTLVGSSQTFTWTAGSGVSSYWLSAGTSVGANNLFDQGIGSSLTATVTGLPTDGRTVYVRLWWLAGSWGSADYIYTAANTGGGGLAPAITTPSAGATLTGSSQTFTWTAGSGVTSFYLYLGSSAGGNDLFDQNMGSSLSVTAAGLPTDGRTIYARLWWQLNGGWEYADTTYTAARSNTNAAITTPAAGATLSGSSQTFTWTVGSGVTSYWLYLGRTAGGNDLLDRNMGSSLSVTAAGLPTDGRTIYARLWWQRNGGWEWADTTYTAAGNSSANPAITTPAVGATLSGSSQTFTWTAGSGVTSFYLYLGSSAGSNDLFDRDMGWSLSVTAAGLPTDGRTIYARLWWQRNGGWEYADTTYTAARSSTNPAITTPAVGATLGGSSQTFTWTAGSGVTSYWLYLGRTAGGNDLLDRNMGSSLSVTAGGLPTDGRTIYARLWWQRNGGWEYADTTYTAAR